MSVLCTFYPYLANWLWYLMYVVYVVYVVYVLKTSPSGDFSSSHSQLPEVREQIGSRRVLYTRKREYHHPPSRYHLWERPATRGSFAPRSHQQLKIPNTTTTSSARR